MFDCMWVHICEVSVHVYVGIYVYVGGGAGILQVSSSTALHRLGTEAEGLSLNPECFISANWASQPATGLP